MSLSVKVKSSLENMIETHDLTRMYGNFVAVDHLNISVHHGEIFGLLGPNGAGKTTTISMLCTILRPTSGSATVNGFDIVKQPAQVRKSLGIVFQEPSVDDRLTGRENMIMHANLYGVPKDVWKKRVPELLRLVELEDRADHLLRTYSGGMRRRLEIARGLLHYPRVLFLDEPTIGLDPQTREHIWRYITALSKDQDITIVLTTHYMDEADLLCNRIAIVDFGKIVALDSPDQLKSQLGEETISIKTHEVEKLSRILTDSGLISGKDVNKDELKVKVKNGSETLPRIVEVSASAGIRIDAILLHQPNLGDVFLRYTGRAIREEKGEEYHGMTAARRRAVP
jgi:ABC-2 type transport system ATP-binding protein